MRKIGQGVIRYPANANVGRGQRRRLQSLGYYQGAESTQPVSIACGVLRAYTIVVFARVVLEWDPVGDEHPVGRIPPRPAARHQLLRRRRAVALLPPVRMGSVAVDLSPLILILGLNSVARCSVERAAPNAGPRPATRGVHVLRLSLSDGAPHHFQRQHFAAIQPLRRARP